MGFNNPLTGLNGSLIYPQIKSPNFNLAAKTGWAILKNGNAYFFNVTATGSVTSTTVLVEGPTGGIFIYSGVPGSGNLIGSWAGAAGSDAFSNAYPQGLNVSLGAISGSAISGSAISGGTVTGSTINGGSIMGAKFVAYGANGLMLGYSGTPAAGNLVFAVSPTAGSDSFGNGYAQGVNVMVGNTGIVVSETGGSPLLYFYTGRSAITNSSALQVITQGTGTAQYEQMQILGAQDSTQKDAVDSAWTSSSPDGTQMAQILDFYHDPSGGYHFFRSLSYKGDIVSAGSINAVQPGTGTSRTNVAVAETWHTPVLASGWATGTGTNPPLMYKMLADSQCVKIWGYASFTGTPGAGQAVFTLPTGYYSTTYVFVSGGAYDTHNSAYVPVEVSTTGAVTLFKGAGITANIFFDVTIYLGV